MTNTNFARMESLADDEMQAADGGWEPQNGMQALAANLHWAWNHTCAAVSDFVQAVGQAEMNGILPMM